MEPDITIETPLGCTHLQPDNHLETGNLAEWLERHHFPLNTRCGGRGLCRGCLIEVDGQQVRACQHPSTQVSRIVIPEASQRDLGINGVSVFEIGAHTFTLTPRPGIGLALDVGTTTVAAALWDLSTGTCLAQGSVANEQRRYGDNVLSRIDHAVALGGSSPALQSALVKDSLEPLILRLCKQARIAPSMIGEAVAAGNTVMLHSLAAARLSGFAAYPFQPVFINGQDLNAEDVGFSWPFHLRLAPNLGPFVGADISLGALASGILESGGPALLIDFGTNGEILLKTPDGFLATATAAGPAFEGGRLRCGAPAGKGVISSMARNNDKWDLRFTNGETVSRATGISGAAYVDFMFYALKSGLINGMGRFESGHPEVHTRESSEGIENYITIQASQYISETDVAELIQAKAAIAAGVMALLEEACLSPEKLETVYIAGGFGYHLNCTHAMAIGMMPYVDPARIRVIGNAALGGASLALQVESTATIENLRQCCRVIELNQIDSFEDHFIDCMPLERIQ